MRAAVLFPALTPRALHPSGFDLSWQITANWFLRANYGYLDASYENFVADIDGGAVIEPTDNSYLRPRNTPENTFGINTTYTLPIGSGTLQGVLAYRYRDSIEVDLSVRFRRNRYRPQIAEASGQWAVSMT